MNCKFNIGNQCCCGGTPTHLKPCPGTCAVGRILSGPSEEELQAEFDRDQAQEHAKAVARGQKAAATRKNRSSLKPVPKPENVTGSASAIAMVGLLRAEGFALPDGAYTIHAIHPGAYWRSRGSWAWCLEGENLEFYQHSEGVSAFGSQWPVREVILAWREGKLTSHWNTGDLSLWVETQQVAFTRA